MKTKLSDLIRLRDIVDFPEKINDIFEICQNEINLLKDADLVAVEFYTAIYCCCLLEAHKLTLNHF